MNKPITAQALGNPPDEEHEQQVASYYLPDCEEFRRTQWEYDSRSPPRYGATGFTRNTDSTIFDTKCLIEVTYDWNVEIENCKENEVIRDRGFLDPVFFRTVVLPHIDKPLPLVTHIVLKTLKDSISIVPMEVPLKVYPTIPAGLELLQVPISQLRRLPMFLLGINVDAVTIDDGTSDDKRYAFKHTCSLEYESPAFDHDILLLAELEQLEAIRSPFIIRPSFVVTDTTRMLFRGFLTPFMPAGTLRDVLGRLHSEKPTLSSKSGEELQPITLPQDVIKDVCGPSKLMWAIKHTWAIEIASAIATLHDTDSYCGDIKLDNILLDTSGHIQLIDIAPVEGYTAEYPPPELILCLRDPLSKGELPQSAARDIFALGLVLWQIGSEISGFHRDECRSPVLIWREDVGEGSEAVPNWFCDLVEQCICEDPGRRPSARYILSVLEEELPAKHTHS